MRGRKPTKTAKAANVRPDKPGHLTPSAAAAWDELCESLDGLGTLSAVDRMALTTLAELIGLQRDAYNQITKTGTVIKLPNGWPGPTPFLAVYTKTTAQIKTLLADFGLTPGSRTAATEDAEDDAPTELEY